MQITLTPAVIKALSDAMKAACDAPKTPSHCQRIDLIAQALGYSNQGTLMSMIKRSQASEYGPLVGSFGKLPPQPAPWSLAGPIKAVARTPRYEIDRLIDARPWLASASTEQIAELYRVQGGHSDVTDEVFKASVEAGDRAAGAVHAYADYYGKKIICEIAPSDVTMWLQEHRASVYDEVCELIAPEDHQLLGLTPARTAL